MKNQYNMNNYNYYHIKDNQQGIIKISNKLITSNKLINNYLFTKATNSITNLELKSTTASVPGTPAATATQQEKQQTNKQYNNLSRDIKNPNYLYFLGGFVEGEGSNSVAITVGKEFKFGVNLQPVFNVSQHVNGINILHSFKELFGAGSVVQKSGSEDVWVYTIKGYKQIIELVLPFLETYVQPYSCKKNEYAIFKKLVLDSAAGHQKQKDTLIEMVKLAYTLTGKGKGKSRKRTLPEVLEIINDKSILDNKIIINDN
jgi:LAGLIDADG DNA endonuclease family protein